MIQLSFRLSRHTGQETSSHRRAQTGTGRGLTSQSLCQRDSGVGCEVRQTARKTNQIKDCNQNTITEAKYNNMRHNIFINFLSLARCLH